MAKVNYIIIHCSDSDFGCLRIIDSWHKNRGWNSCGYHFVIGNGKPSSDIYNEVFDGQIECGRPIFADGTADLGAHCLGYNHNSVGICLIGKETFTDKQLNSAYKLSVFLLKLYKLNVDSILGHCETVSGRNQGKTCPNLNMSTFRENVKLLL